jgi:hypothetical protein
MVVDAFDHERVRLNSPTAPQSLMLVHAIVRSPVATASRLLLALALVAGAQAAFAGAATAVEPENDGSTKAVSLPVGQPVKGGEAPQAKPGPGGGGSTTRGFDISYPQCGGAYPANPAFGIVGVNGGRVLSVNPCLASQITWGGGAAAELYVNTGNPGPALSSYWPVGQTSPRVCSADNPDTADCAFDYGYNAARHSYETAVAAYQQLGIATSPSATVWWLDVETSNSWRDENLSLNVAALEGEVAYLRDVAGVTRLGFYSTTLQWGVITGGTKVFAAYPSWGAGARSDRAARNLCESTTTSFTGGALVLVQYPYQGYDANVRC